MENLEVAETEYGKVQGIRKTSALHTEYISFQGIPYMKAPLGKLRFHDPQVPDAWSNVFDAAEDIPSYYTRNLVTFEFEGQENAGIINVFTKNLKPDKLYPVMVWVIKNLTNFIKYLEYIEVLLFLRFMVVDLDLEVQKRTFMDQIIYSKKT